MCSTTSLRIATRAALVLSCLTVGWSAAVAALVRIGRDLGGPLASGSVAGDRLVDSVAGATAVAAALAVITWFACSLGGAVLAGAAQAVAPARSAGQRHPGRQPLPVRRLAALLLGCGLAVAPAAGPASAADAGQAGRDRPAAVASVDRPAPGRHHLAPAGNADGSTVRVRPGDTLWAIAARHLGADPPDAAVARAWPRWHHANRTRIGSDPDLIVPGQLLHAPIPEETR